MKNSLDEIKQKKPFVSVAKSDSGNSTTVNIKNLERAMDSLGSNDLKYFESKILEISKHFQVGCKDPDEIERKINSCLEILNQQNPKNCLEGITLIHIVLLSDLIQKYSITAISESGILMGNPSATKQLVQLIRAYNDSLDSLGKYQRGGKQKVTVQHIHVSDNSNAVIGDINQKKAK